MSEARAKFGQVDGRTSVELAHEQLINITKQVMNISERLNIIEDTLIEEGILDIDEAVTRLIKEKIDDYTPT